MAIASASLLLPVTSAVLSSAQAEAREDRFSLDIPAGPLGGSLSMLSQAAGLSVGISGAMPHFQTHHLRGKFSGAAALKKLLAGSGYVAVRVAPQTYRLERERATSVPARPAAAARPNPAPESGNPIAEPDIVVTAQKRSQQPADVPMSLAVVGDGTISQGRPLPGSRDLAFTVEGLALTNLGPGRNRQFIRGVADSPFNGPSQSTVAVVLDEARITFDAPDPDLRLVDVQRVEILKGPQGPLYGSGALGGLYHVVTRKPDLGNPAGSVKILTEAVEHGSPGVGGEAVVNLPLSRDRLALRAVGYAAVGGGWIDNVGGHANANLSRTHGARLALRWEPSPSWTVDLSGVAQYVNVADSQYVKLAGETLQRTARLPEPTDNDFRSIAASAEGRVGAFRLLSATSYVNHAVDFTLDASDAATQLGVITPAAFRGDRLYTIFNQELRISPESGNRWVAGVSYLRAASQEKSVITADSGFATAIETLNRRVTEYALFGEASLPLVPKVGATLGARLFRTIAENEALERTNASSDRIAKTAISPSVAVSWKPSERSVVYLRYARALRPGGLAASNQVPSRRFDSDELGTFDFGVRHQQSDRGLSFGASLFLTDWRHIQSDYLLSNGLISTRNAGRGRIAGGEAGIDWQILPTWLVSTGYSYQNARLTHTENGLELEDRRLPVAPNMTGRLLVSHGFRLGPWTTAVAAQANYVGRARLAFDEDLDRKMGNYASFSTNASFARGRLTIGARIDNLLDVTGDSFAFGNPFSIRTSPQYTPLRPRTFTLSIERSW
jgi:iron complex outermembrane receptor protein